MDLNNKVNGMFGNTPSVESTINVTAFNTNTTANEQFINVSPKRGSGEDSIEMPEVSLDQQSSFSTILTSETMESSSTSKLSRQRIALNNKLMQEVQSHASIAPNYTKDPYFLTETSLSIKPTTAATELTPPLTHGTTSSTSNNSTYNYSEFADNPSTEGVQKTSTSAAATLTSVSTVSELKLEQDNIHSSIETCRDSASSVSTIMSPCALPLKDNSPDSSTPITTNICSSAQSVFLPGQIEDGTTAIVESAVNQPEPKNLHSSTLSFSNASFIFPSPLLSSSDSESDGSYALSHPQVTVIQKTWRRPDQLPGVSTSTNAIISHDHIYVPQQNHSLSLFEPELLLSPAKLGQ